MTKLDERLSFDHVAFMSTSKPTSYDNRVGTSLYIIKSESYCKIGIAENVEKRLETFRGGNPHPLTLVRQHRFNSRLHALLAERTTHKVLSNYSIGREWFEIDPKLAANAAGHVTGWVKRLVVKWERAETEVRRAEELRYRTDPEYRAEIDAQHETRKSAWQAIREENIAVMDLRTSLRIQRRDALAASLAERGQH